MLFGVAKVLIAIVYEYCKNLWNPFQITCQTQLRGRRVGLIEWETLGLTSNYLIRFIGSIDENTYVELWNLKEKKLERTKTLDFIGHFQYTAFSWVFHNEEMKIYNIITLTEKTEHNPLTDIPLNWKETKKDISTNYIAFLDQFERKSKKNCRLNIWHLHEEKLVKQWMISEFPKRLHFLSNQNQLVIYYEDHVEIWNISGQIENNGEIMYGLEAKGNRLVILVNKGKKTWILG